MVEWTAEERCIIQSIFDGINYEEVGAEALQRCLTVYPWTQRHFASFGNLFSAEAIQNNPNVAKHGTKVLHGLDLALRNMDCIKSTYAELSVLHSETLHVDPDNFRLLGDCLCITISRRMGPAFNPVVHAAFQKFIAVVVSALGKQYH